MLSWKAERTKDLLPGLRIQALGPCAWTGEGTDEQMDPQRESEAPLALASQSVICGQQHDVGASQKCRVLGPTQTH